MADAQSKRELTFLSYSYVVRRVVLEFSTFVPSRPPRTQRSWMFTFAAREDIEAGRLSAASSAPCINPLCLGGPPWIPLECRRRGREVHRFTASKAPGPQGLASKKLESRKFASRFSAGDRWLGGCMMSNTLSGP